MKSWGCDGYKLVSGRPIMPCEGGMVPLTMFEVEHRLVNRRVLWILDNAPSLFSFIAGRSGSAVLDRSVAMTKFLQARWSSSHALPPGRATPGES